MYDWSYSGRVPEKKRGQSQTRAWSRGIWRIHHKRWLVFQHDLDLSQRDYDAGAPSGFHSDSTLHNFTLSSFHFPVLASWVLLTFEDWISAGSRSSHRQRKVKNHETGVFWVSVGRSSNWDRSCQCRSSNLIDRASGSLSPNKCPFPTSFCRSAVESVEAFKNFDVAIDNDDHIAWNDALHVVETAKWVSSQSVDFSQVTSVGLVRFTEYSVNCCDSLPELEMTIITAMNSLS